MSSHQIVCMSRPEIPNQKSQNHQVRNVLMFSLCFYFSSLLPSQGMRKRKRKPSKKHFLTTSSSESDDLSLAQLSVRSSTAAATQNRIPNVAIPTEPSLDLVSGKYANPFHPSSWGNPLIYFRLRPPISRRTIILTTMHFR